METSLCCYCFDHSMITSLKCTSLWSVFWRFGGSASHSISAVSFDPATLLCSIMVVVSLLSECIPSFCVFSLEYVWLCDMILYLF